MKSFSSLSSFADHLAYGTLSTLAYIKLLDEIGERVQTTAQGKMGTYQVAVGPFPAWAPLSKFTQGNRTSLGLPANEPLYRYGTLQASIEYEVDKSDLSVTIGSHEMIALYQEVGTSSIPSRSFLGASLYEIQDWLKDRVATTGMRHILGGLRSGGESGYYPLWHGQFGRPPGTRGGTRSKISIWKGKAALRTLF